MHPFVFHNDRVLPLNQVRLSPGQAGLLSGWGLFTTLRLYDGQPFAFERHWQRFRRDAARINLPFTFAEDRVLANLREVVRANQVKDGTARIYFIYNRFGFWQSTEALPEVDLLIYTGDLLAHPPTLRLTVQGHGRYAAHPLAGTKVTSWLHNVWCLEQARRRGCDEVILLNEREEVAECTGANFLCVRRGQIETPPLSSGCLAGVTREVLMELGPAIGLPIAEQALTLLELYAADEVFVTSTTRGVHPVSQIEEQRWREAPGPVTAQLAQAFSDYVQNYFARRTLSPRTSA